MYKLNWRRWNNKQVVSICIISKLDNGSDHEIIPSPPHFQFVQRPTFLPYCIFDTMELSLAPCSARNWEAGCLLLLKLRRYTCFRWRSTTMGLAALNGCCSIQRNSDRLTGMRCWNSVKGVRSVFECKQKILLFQAHWRDND